MSVESIAVPLGQRVQLSPRTRNGLGVAATALALGALGDALLRPVPWGINLTLWAAALIAAAAALQRWAATDDAQSGWIPVALTVSALIAWRDSPTLKMLDLTVLAVILALAIYRARGGSVRVAGIARYCAGMLDALAQATFGAVPLLFTDVKWREIPRDGWTRHALAAVRGVAIALPLLLLFGSLLVAADAAFDSLVSSTFNIDMPRTLGHVFLTLFFGWGAAGVLRGLVIPPEAKDGALPAGASPATAVRAWEPRMGIVEVATVLTLLDVLFLSFVIVQLPHFFGSYQHLLQPGTGTFADYAVRGFFELCVVAGLVLPMLMGLHWLLRKESPRAQAVFRVAAGAMVGLVFVIIASALHRMRLYQSAYGLTELRLYTTAFMFWLSAVFGWFCWTVLRDRRDRFAFGALTAAVETVILLHVVNPDALIVRVNAGREASPVRFDALYATSLSGDAVPALLDRWHAVPGDARCEVVDRLFREWNPANEDWRAWSLGRHRAMDAVNARRAELRALCPGAGNTTPVRPEEVVPSYGSAATPASAQTGSSSLVTVSLDSEIVTVSAGSSASVPATGSASAEATGVAASPAATAGTQTSNPATATDVATTRPTAGSHAARHR